MADEKPATSPGLQLQPIVHVANMAAAIGFYEHLGAEIIHGGRDGDWTLIQLGTTQIGLLLYPPDPNQGEGVIELNFAAEIPLDQFEQRLRRAGVAVSGVPAHPHFGAQLQVRSPDGMLIKINQREPDDYE